MEVSGKLHDPAARQEWQYPTNRMLVRPTTGLDVMEKRKISCSYKESNHEASICSPLTTFTMLSQIPCNTNTVNPLMNGVKWGVSGEIMPIVQYSQLVCVCVYIT